MKAVALFSGSLQAMFSDFVYLFIAFHFDLFWKSLFLKFCSYFFFVLEIFFVGFQLFVVCSLRTILRGCVTTGDQCFQFNCTF